MRRIFVLAAFFVASSAVARADCNAVPPEPASLQSLERVADYKPVLKLCKGEAGERVAIREMRLGGEAALLLADPEALTIKLERAACWTCRDADEDELKATRLMRSIAHSAEAPGLTRRGFIENAGITHGQSGGGYFTGDLCPSSKPMDRTFLETLEGESQPTPIALSISGLWLKHHFDDYKWLLDAEARGRLAITWVNHTYSHPFHRGVDSSENFLLSAGVDVDHEILDTERFLIANGRTPSLFFRFPGLVSSSELMQAVSRRHLISLGADAWLALNRRPHDGSIILVHPNGNEETGLKIYAKETAAGVAPSPLKPLDEAPEP